MNKVSDIRLLPITVKEESNETTLHELIWDYYSPENIW